MLLLAVSNITTFDTNSLKLWAHP